MLLLEMINKKQKQRNGKWALDGKEIIVREKN